MTREDRTIPDAEELAARAHARMESDRRLHPDEAVAEALRAVGAPASRLPRPALVRRHLAALRDERRAPGAGAAAADVLVSAALDVLATLEAVVLERDPDGPARPAPTVHGRAAALEVGEGDVLSVRVTTSLRVCELADALVHAGFPDPRCTTRETRLGRLDLVELDLEHGSIRITRLPPGLRADRARDLVRGRPLRFADYEQLSRRLAR